MVHLNENVLHLTWKGPLTIRDKDIYDEELPGLYLFTFLIENYFTVHYIGKTESSLCNRLVGTGSTTGHLRDYISGRYYVYDSNDLFKAKNDAKVLYKSCEFYEYFSNIEQSVKNVINTISKISFYYCTFDTCVEYIEYAESLLIYHAFENRKLFPTLDNSERTMNRIFGFDIKNISIINEFGNNIIKGLIEPIHFPKEI